MQLPLTTYSPGACCWNSTAMAAVTASHASTAAEHANRELAFWFLRVSSASQACRPAMTSPFSMPESCGLLMTAINVRSQQ